MNKRRALSAAALLALSSLPTLALEAKPEEAKKTPPAPSEHVVKAAPFKIEIELDALLVAKKEHQISLAPETWKDMSVLSVIPHGTRVKKGERLLTLDTEKLRKAIDEAELAEPAAKLELVLAQAKLTSAKKSTPVKLEAARRAKRIADDDWAHYEASAHAEALEAARRSIEYAQQRHSYAQEEYQQLQKMYEADDLTEETEEIILRRAKINFEHATENLRLAKMGSQREIRILIPRERIAKKAAVESGNQSYNDTARALPRLLEQQRHAVEKSQRERALATRKLRDMKTDLASFDLRAPADGIVYYGASKNGKWITAPIIAKKLIPGGKLSPRQVFMTIAETGPLGLVATIPEEKLALLKPGLTGTAIPVSNPSLRIPTKVTRVSYVPGAFTAQLTLDTDAARLFPGMKAKVKLAAANFERAITVPNTLIDDDAVWVQGEDGKKQRRPVRTGPTDGKSTVILKGLKEGEKVVAK